ncbi:hypothetical protein K7X08_034003 [Anisodus acutangulus]|uniref:Uncharacterized protein n=1 Tax=Anisodus acutangulus TaxID=402998 RepID=A0A9Q1R5D9_9SOLA|nr:hypothetical protein K7X08_034003 [Anisodus acutangulus]
MLPRFSGKLQHDKSLATNFISSSSSLVSNHQIRKSLLKTSNFGMASKATINDPAKGEFSFDFCRRNGMLVICSC